MLPERLKDITEIPDPMLDMIAKSVENTFTQICSMEPELVHHMDESMTMEGIIGNIAVFNPLHTLSIMLAVPRDMAVALSVPFVGMELDFESDDIGDLIGEICNILAGEVAANIETVGFRGQSSLPTATRGSDLRLFLPNKPPTAKMKFELLDGNFWVYLALFESQRTR